MQRTGFAQLIIAVLLASALLSACSGTAPKELINPDLISSPQQWLDLAEQEIEPNKSQYQLNAARLYLRSGRIDTARQLLDTTQPPNQGIQHEWYLISAQLFLSQGDNDQAAAEHGRVNASTLNSSRANEYYAVQTALARMQKDYWLAAQSLAKRYRLSDAAIQPQLQKQLWSMIEKAQQTQARLDETQISADFSGWLSLYNILHGEGELSLVLKQLYQWQTEQAGHPAAAMLPANLTAAIAGGCDLPKRIAVILPLSGKYKDQGLAIRNGLLQAMLERDHLATQLHFYDSGRLLINDIYSQIQTHQEELIVGPLLKPNVRSLLEINQTQLPVLALNQVDADQMAAHVNYFALTPESEAHNAVHFMRQLDVKHPLLLQAASSSYQRIGQAFEQAWQKPDTPDAKWTTAIVAEGQSKVMQTQIQTIMDVTASKARASKLSKDLGLSLEHEPRSRADIDAIYVAASPQQARLLKSFVDVTLSPFSEPVKVLVGPRSHSEQHAELDGIYVADISLIQSEQFAPLRHQLQALQPDWHYTDLRLFAMGYDTFNLLTQRLAMRQLPGYTVSGLSGKLSITAQGEINALTPWGRYQQGVLVPMTTP